MSRKGKFHYDPLDLIELVEQRPCIWDKTREEFKDRLKREEAWKEIYVFLIDGFKDLKEEEQAIAGKAVNTKWRHIRDAFAYSLKKKNGEKKKRRYLYYDQLQFLLKFIEKDETELSIVDTDTETQYSGDEETSFLPPRQLQQSVMIGAELASTPASVNFKNRNRKNLQEETDKSIFKALEATLQPPCISPTLDEDTAFFTSIIPAVKKFSENEKLEFRMGVLGLIKNIKEERCASQLVHDVHPSTSSYSNTSAYSSPDYKPISGKPIQKSEMEREKIIIDCDAGTDDALSLILLVEAHKINKIEIMGITCVSGNTFVDNVIANVFRTLAVCNANDIPVFKGAYSPLLSTENAKIAANTQFHGLDGFGDVYTDEPDTSKLKSEHAVCALQRIVSQYPGEVSILGLGPLTNIALAIKMYPDFADCVNKFYIMGGNYTAVGNVTPQAEFNFYADPESAHIVLCSSNKLWLLPWETCLKSQVSNEWRLSVFGEIDTPTVQLMNAIEGGTYSTPEKMLPTYTPCDAFLAGIVLNPKMVTCFVPHHIDIELSGNRTRGQVVIDHFMNNKPNAFIIQDFDSEIFKDLLLFAANPYRYKNNAFRDSKKLSGF